MVNTHRYLVNNKTAAINQTSTGVCYINQNKTFCMIDKQLIRLIIQPPKVLMTLGYIMKKNNSFINGLVSILTAFFLSTTSFAEPANLALLKQDIKNYHDSGTYEKELNHVISNAQMYVLKRVKFNEHLKNPQKLAVVLDIDETCLTNYNNMVSREFTWDKKLTHQETLAANAPPIRPMLSFYNSLLKQGVAVFFVTGRATSERFATEKNLKYAGYHDWTGLYLKPKDYKQPSAIPFKSETRANISKRGYTIIASIGDQISDLKGGYADKLFKLPNPYYFIP